ncbi:MAG: hypothetical protein KDC88_06640, partial [Ignavibacteriae bacterium]|nr:hypothetical protein [Ignavibacteriota bacterium]
MLIIKMKKIILTFTLLFFTSSLSSLSAQNMVPIKIDLPKAMFVGTPTNMSIEKLEKPLGKPRPPFLAPEGTKNVALGKAVTSTDDMPIIGEIDYITDGEKDADEGYFVELGPF